MESSTDVTGMCGPPSPDQSKRKKKRDKVRSAWISFIGRILAQILGAVAMITLGLTVADRMNGDRTERAHAADGVLQRRTAPAPRTSGDLRPAVAVLPLASFSSDSGQRHLADGLMDELIGALEEIPGLRVVPRTSSMQYRLQPRSIPEIASELGVDFVVEGCLKRDGDRIRITLRVIDGKQNTSVGSETYNRPVRDALRLDTDLASSVARDLASIILAPAN
ncbi:MAG TPA: hypothetical protein VLD67_22075 [Vicinamibacterales bacterium]|nr:hypothetical protein [Vicinamibacterales bacterium]